MQDLERNQALDRIYSPQPKRIGAYPEYVQGQNLFSTQRQIRPFSLSNESEFCQASEEITRILQKTRKTAPPAYNFDVNSPLPLYKSSSQYEKPPPRIDSNPLICDDLFLELNSPSSSNGSTEGSYN